MSLPLIACAPDARVAQLERRVDSLAVTVTALVNARRGTGADAPALSESLTVSLAGAAAAGDPQAPVVIVEFTDYQCPFCGRHFQQTLPELRRNYISTGKARYIVRDLPLKQIHPYSAKAATATRCAAAQAAEQYWHYHDALFSNQKDISDTLFPRIAQRIGLNIPKFRTCLNSPEAALLVERDVAEAERLGFTGTPAFVIGRPRRDGTVRGVLIRGAYPLALFAQAIDAALGTPAIVSR